MSAGNILGLVAAVACLALWDAGRRGTAVFGGLLLAVVVLALRSGL